MQGEFHIEAHNAFRFRNRLCMPTDAEIREEILIETY